MAFIISVANEKGGVAKTTTVTSLGATLNELGLRVLVVDLDTQANLSLGLGIEPEKVTQSLVKVFLESAPIKNTVVETHISGLDIIPSNIEMGMVERFLPVRSGYETTLRHAIENNLPEYDFILIDCPPFLGSVTLNALVASNLLLIPTQAEYFSIYALRNLMNLVRRIRGQYNPGLTYRLLLTMYDKRNRIHRNLNEQLYTTFGNGMFTTIIETDTKLREAPIAGLPIIYHAPKSRASIQYRALAQEIHEYVKETTAQPA
jgi:chromosome partitioning protein